MSCIITGCAIIDKAYPKWRWGDLYRTGDVFIHYSEQEWSEGNPREGQDLRALIVIPEGHYAFNRNGVVVVSRQYAYLSDAAKEYLHE